MHDLSPVALSATELPIVDFQTHPDRYRHWRLALDPAQPQIARLILDVDETAGLRPGYALKLNSYDLGVDIELNDALQRLRFEHPTVAVVILTSGKERVFCSGANIFMLGVSDHAWKVNFCKFTNETRNGMEDDSQHAGLKFLAAVTGACAGGGYELALACDEIVLIDDRSATVSLPEVPLLGVLPGTGGLTRLTDKRRVRHDLADLFCTTTEGVRGQRAKDWRLVDAAPKPAQFEAEVLARARQLAAASRRPLEAQGVVLLPLAREIHRDALRYTHVHVEIDRARRVAHLTVHGPAPDALPADLAGLLAQGAGWYPLALARDLEDALLTLRTQEPEIGTWLIRSVGTLSAQLASDALLCAHREHWLVRETLGYLRRTLSRLDVSSRSLFALIEPGACFAGLLLELVLACDRSYMLALPDEPDRAPRLALGELNFSGDLQLATGQTRLARRFYDDAATLTALRDRLAQPLDADTAIQLGLVTRNPDDLDWADETRLAVEERAAMSPDALSGLEANLRFNGRETLFSRVFGRLSAWQNWIFQRPNAVGDKGALKVYGKGEKAAFDPRRV